MSAAPSRSAEQLNRIAAALGLPVEAFTAAASPPAPNPAPGALVAALLFDPDGRRMASAWPHLSPQARKAIADTIAIYIQTAPDASPRQTEGRS